VIDVLVADHLPRSLRPRIAGRSVMAIDGGAQALERSTQLRVRTGATEAEILLPNLLGALILKAAASRVDRRDNGRHLQDAALIAALITDHGAARANMHGSDRRRLMGLAAALADPASPAWLTLPSDLAQQGQDTLRILTA
jgi:hypothetical protein